MRGVEPTCGAIWNDSRRRETYPGVSRPYFRETRYWQLALLARLTPKLGAVTSSDACSLPTSARMRTSVTPRYSRPYSMKSVRRRTSQKKQPLPNFEGAFDGIPRSRSTLAYLERQIASSMGNCSGAKRRWRTRSTGPSIRDCRRSSRHVVPRESRAVNNSLRPPGSANGNRPANRGPGRSRLAPESPSLYGQTTALALPTRKATTDAATLRPGLFQQRRIEQSPRIESRHASPTKRCGRLRALREADDLSSGYGLSPVTLLERRREL